jgi:CheY-like chemotaxis protein
VKTKILVVDDEFASADVLSLILGDEGYEAHCAVNGRDGLERVAELAPALVVLDYMMPVMNGGDMGRALRAAPATRHIKILMNSSLPEAAVREHFSDYDAFLRKPFDAEVALALIARLLQADDAPAR